MAEKTPNPAAQALGSLGGKARAKRYTKQQLSAMAKLAWKRKRKPK